MSQQSYNYPYSFYLGHEGCQLDYCLEGQLDICCCLGQMPGSLGCLFMGHKARGIVYSLDHGCAS